MDNTNVKPLEELVNSSNVGYQKLWTKWAAVRSL
jgi:hypothetical protein